MVTNIQLCLHEEIMLLALRDEKGTAVTAYTEHMVAGAILAELLLDHRITIEDSRKQLVNTKDNEPTDDLIINECLQRIATEKRRASMQTWVSRLAGMKHLKHKVAQQLCNKEILRCDEEKILLIFARQVYPEINPLPEKRIIARLKAAIFTDSIQVDPRTAVLVSLADGTDLMNYIFGRKELQRREKRIEQVVNGELIGRAAKEAIAACKSAAAIAAIIPAVTATTIHS